MWPFSRNSATEASKAGVLIANNGKRAALGAEEKGQFNLLLESHLEQSHVRDCYDLLNSKPSRVMVIGELPQTTVTGAFSTMHAGRGREEALHSLTALSYDTLRQYLVYPKGKLGGAFFVVTDPDLSQLVGVVEAPRTGAA